MDIKNNYVGVSMTLKLPKMLTKSFEENGEWEIIDCYSASNMIIRMHIW